MQLQNDNSVNGLYKTRARQVLSTTRQDHIVETSSSAYVENSTRWTEVFRTNAGLRADHYRFDVARIGRKDDTLLSPSISMVLGPWAQTEFYLNAGNGFHSNDARGVLDADNPATPLARSRGQELGVRSEWVRGLQSSLSLYKLDFDSELVFIGDAGNTEASRPSRRYGVEFSNYWKPLKWLSVDADLAFARGRYRDEDPAGDRIPGAIEGVGQLALTVAPSGPWSGSLRMRYFGPRPLVEDNSVRSRGTRTVNGRIGYRISKRTHIELEGFNLSNRRDSAIEYYYASRLAGEAAPVDDIHFHPIESRSFRLTINTSF
jgi:outer membrane receptor protein involved in Fe transport